MGCTPPTRVRDGAWNRLLRVYLPGGIAGNAADCEIMIDQSRAIDNRSIKGRLGKLPPRRVLMEVKEKLRVVGDL